MIDLINKKLRDKIHDLEIRLALMERSHKLLFDQFKEVQGKVVRESGPISELDKLYGAGYQKGYEDGFADGQAGTNEAREEE